MLFRSKLSQLSDSGKEVLSTTISDLEGYIESSIETALKQIKVQAITAVTDTTNIAVENTKVIDGALTENDK